MEAGPYSYGLNLILPALLNGISVNSKRVERRFRLCSVSSQSIFSSADYFVKLGTEKVDWFGDYVLAATIMGDGVYPHWLPGGGQGMIIEAGDYIVAECKNNSSSQQWLAFIFNGVHI